MIRVLFDQGGPLPLKDALGKFEIQTCFTLGWPALSNGELIARADESFDVFVTTDKNVRYQQNLTHRRVAIFVLPTTRWPTLKPYGELIESAMLHLRSGAYEEWCLPD